MNAIVQPGSSQAAALDRDGVHQVLETAARALVGGGLWPTGRRFGPDDEAAVLALAILAMGVPDQASVIPKFLNLTISLLAKTQDEIEALSRLFAGRESEDLLDQIFLFAEAANLGFYTVHEERRGEEPAVEGSSPRAARPTRQSVDQPPVPSQATGLNTIRRYQSLISTLSQSWNLFAARCHELWKRLLSATLPQMPRARLVRDRLAEAGRSFTLQLSGASARDADAYGHRRAAIRLSSWESRGSYRLDLRRTIRATLKRGGLFRPVWRPVRKTAEYVFLIHGLGRLDLEQERLRQLTAELAKAGVPLASYFYLTDPRQLRELSSAGDGTFRNLDLARVAARHPFSRLIIFSTGHELLHPMTLKPMSWTTALMTWPRRALLSPVPSADWGMAEALLRGELNLLIGSSRPQGLLDIAADLGPERSPAHRQASAEQGAGELVGTADLRYVTDAAPLIKEQLGLIDRIRAYLGDRGFEWLALCACYPELSLDLTVYLRRYLEPGRQLAVTGDRTTDEDLFARLVSLCWFRHGFLPAWLRRRIMASLPRRRRLELRRAVAAMLAEARMTARSETRLGRPPGQGQVSLPLWERLPSPGSGREFDAVTLDFLLDGPTHDIDPLLRVAREREEPPPPPPEAQQSPTSAVEEEPATQTETPLSGEAPATQTEPAAQEEGSSLKTEPVSPETPQQPVDEPAVEGVGQTGHAAPIAQQARGSVRREDGALAPLCFVLMPFGRKTDAAGRVTNFDSIYQKVIAPAVEAAGLEPVRADEEKIGGTIHRPTFERLMLCPYAVADITGANPNVFYELGIRHARRSQNTVILFAAGTVIPFDLAHVRGIPYRTDGAGEPIEVEASIEVVAQQLRAAREHRADDSPLAQLVDALPYSQIDHTKVDIFRAQIGYSKRYKERLAAAVRGGADAVEKIAAEPGLANLNEVEAGVVVDLYLSMRDVKSYQSMIKLYERMPPPLQRARLVREQLGFALNREGHFDEAEKVLREVIHEFGPSSETNGLLGRVYKDRWDIARRENRPAAAGMLRRAIDTYLDGFEADWRDAYPGSNAVILMEALAHRDPRQAKLLPVVRYSAVRKKEKAADYWDYATLLELAVLADDHEDADEQLAEAIAMARAGWELETTTRNLSFIRDARTSRGEDAAWIQNIEAELLRTAGALSMPGPGA